MVYVKPDGTQGFSWKLQYDFLLKEHPEMLEEIAHARFEMLASDQPEQAAYYKDLGDQLRAKINAASDQNKEFGYIESDSVTKEFVKENDLMTLFEDVPGLSSQIDYLDFSFLEEDGAEPIGDLTDANFDAWLSAIILD